MFQKFYQQKKLFLLGLATAAIVAAIDLYSKKLVFAFLDDMNPEHPELAITDFFNLVKVWNKGISFGMLNHIENGKYIILAINLSILAVLLVWLYRNKITYLTWAISLIIGGAMGNIIDRICNHAVADFLDFYIGNYHWPAFNLADSAVFLGVTLLLLENYFVKKDEK
ncbi:MAG: lspA [Rickettsiaceae bacterium]|jgi:signal peptidase II|nr:lspA [Rickettsiaceae bacterium]